MSSHLEAEAVRPDSAAAEDRRRHQRHPGRALAEVVRETDPLRHVLRVELLDVSMTGVGVLTSTTFKHDERVRVRLRNIVQRFLKEVRGVVRWSVPTPDGKFRVGVEMLCPFTAVDMQMLRRAGIGTNTDAPKTWI